MNRKLEQILEKPIDRRNFLKNSASALIVLRNAGTLALLEEVLENLSGCAAIGSRYITPPNAPQIISEWMADYDPAGRRRSEPHRALDIGGWGKEYFGKDIIAAAEGVIYRIGWDNAGGNYVMIYHGEDVDQKHLATVYMHMDKIIVRQGQKVNRGDELGTIGETGASIAPGYPHVHYIVQHIEIGSGKFPRQNRPNPHNYWVGIDEYKKKLEKEPNIGAFVISCFDPKVNYPEKPVRFTLPVKCK